MLDRQGRYGRLRGPWTLVSVFIVFAMLLSGCGGLQKKKVYHVGILSGLSSFSAIVDGFKAKMTELGYVEGENIVYDVQSTNVDIDVYKQISKKFVDDGVDLILAFPTEAAMEAKIATDGTDIPVVFAMGFTDIPGVNLVNSIREPGGNITGVRYPSVDIASKRLEFLLEIVPNAKRIFVPYLKGYPSVPGQLEGIRSQAQTLEIELVEFGTDSPAELQSEMDKLTGDNSVDAILMLAEPLVTTPSFYDVLGKFSYDNKVPMGGALINLDGYETIFGLRPDARTVGEQTALLADKIFSGTPAGTIPVFTPINYFDVNYRTATEFGLSVPEGLLRLADNVIR